MHDKHEPQPGPGPESIRLVSVESDPTAWCYEYRSAECTSRRMQEYSRLSNEKPRSRWSQLPAPGSEGRWRACVHACRKEWMASPPAPLLLGRRSGPAEQPDMCWIIRSSRPNVDSISFRQQHALATI